MKKYTFNLFVDKEFIFSYKSDIIPVPTDIISLNETEVFTVDKRMLPANDTSDVILLFGTKHS